MVDLKDKIKEELKTDVATTTDVVVAINGMKDDDIRQVLFGIIEEIKVLQKRVGELERK